MKGLQLAHQGRRNFICSTCASFLGLGTTTIVLLQFVHLRPYTNIILTEDV